MTTKILFKLVTTVLVLSYPLLARWLLPLWPAAPGWLLLLPSSLLNAWLAWMFGTTLRARREPMISIFARIERASLSGQPDAVLPPELVIYTRMLTKIWCGLFVFMAVIATLLACFGMLTWWALFTGLISYLLMAALFLGEYLFRRLHFPQYAHVPPLRLMWSVVKSAPTWMRGR